MSKEINEVKETNEVEKEAGVGVYELKRPTKIEGEVVTEIRYDLNRITGLAVRNARTVLGKKAYAVTLPQYDSVYLAALFSEAAELSFESIEALTAKDFENVAGLVKDFLYGEE